MKIAKYVFLFDQAINRVSKRYGIRSLSPSEMFVLYSVQYLPANVKQIQILRHAERMGHSIAQPTLSLAISELVSFGLLEVSNGRVSLSYLGREYISSIRRFLLNKRL